MKKKDFIKYFCNYEVLNVNIYYLYDLDEYSYDIKFKDLKTNPLKFTDIYIKDDQIFINFIIEYCKITSYKGSRVLWETDTPLWSFQAME